MVFEDTYILDVSEKSARRELAKSIQQMLGPYMSKAVVTCDRDLIQILIFPRNDENFKIRRPTLGRIARRGDYEEE